LRRISEAAFNAFDFGSRLQLPEPGVGTAIVTGLQTGMIVANGCVKRAALQSRLKTTDANQPVAMAIIAVVRP
jgi:hypothetical protein